MLKKKLKHGTMMNSFHKTSILCLLTIILSTASPITVYADNITPTVPESNIILEDTYDCSEVVIPEPELEEGIPETFEGTPIIGIEVSYNEEDDVQNYQSSYGISTFSMRSSNIIGSWEIGNPVASNVVATLYSNGLLEFTGTGDTIAYDEISETIPWLQYKDLILDYYIEDTVRPSSTSFWFYDCQNLQYIHEFPDSVYYTQFMFYNCKSITGNIPSFAPLSKVIATNSMFNGCAGLTGTVPSLEYFGNVVDAEFMFQGCSGLTGAIPSFSSMTKVEDIRYMFQQCAGLTSFTDLYGLVSCEDMTEAFNECEGLTGSIPDFDDLGNVKYMNATFRSLRNIDGQIPDFAPLVSVENMNATFTYDHKLKGPIRNISAMTNIRIFADLFTQCYSLDGEIPDFGYLPNLTNACNMFSSCGELTGDIPDLSGLPKLDRSNMMFINCGNLDGDIGDISKLTSLKDAGYMFHGCGKLVGNVPDLSNLTNLADTSYMFSGCGNLTGEIPNLDSLVNVTNTKYMFNGCSKLTGSTPNLDKLTKLKDAAYMFASCSNLDGTIGEFGTLPNLTSIEGIFRYCDKLKGPIPNFDGLTALQAMHYAFMQCSSLTGEIPSFDKLTNLNNMNSTFFKCYNLTGEIPDLSALTKVKYTTQLFYGCRNLTGEIPDLSHFTNILRCNSMFLGCSGLTGPIPDLSALGTATLCGGMFDGCTGLTGEIPDLSGFTKATSLDKMFYNCPGLTEVGEDFAIPSNVTSMSKAFYCPNTTYTKFKTTDPITLAYNWEADNRIPLNVIASWQIGSPNIEDVEATLYNNGLLEFTGVGNTLSWEDETFVPWHEYRESIIEYSIKDTVRPTSMVLWFKDCVNLKHIQPFPSSVQTLSSTFSGCINLTGEIPDLSVAPYLMNIDYAFANCKNLTGNIPSLDWQTNWMHIAGAFAGCENLTGSIPSLSTLNTVEDVSNLFCKCYKLTGSIPNLDSLVNAKYTSQMFMYCENLTGPIPSLDNLVNAEDTHAMFYGCEKLTGSIPSLDSLSNVTNLSQMFTDCYELTGSLPSLDNLSKAENLLGMFAYCGNLTGNIPSLDGLVNAKDLTSMFAGLHYVTGEIPSFDNLTNVENCSSMFMECYSLEGSVPNLKNCTKLHTIDMMFNMCPGIAVIEEDFVLPESIVNKNNVFYWYEEIPIYIYTEDPNTWLYDYKGDNRTIVSDVNAWYIGAPEEWKVVAILNDDGTLSFYGKGDTKQFEDTTRPWYNLKDNVIKYSIENTVKPISMDYWFKDCINMKYLSYIPSSVESLNHTFSGCKSLCGVIPSLHTLTNLQSADYIFAYCENLNTVDSDFILPTNLKDSEGMFKCESFTKTKFLTEDTTALSYDWERDNRKLYKEEWNFGNSSGNFNNIDNEDTQADDNIITTVYLNKDRTYELSFEGSGSMAGFYSKGSMFWKEYLNNITNISIDDEITTIGNYICTDCINVGGNLIISDNVSSIGKEAFANCSSIITLSYPGDINLDNKPFNGVDNLETIILTKGKTGIISYDQSSSNSPCAFNHSYSLYIDEGVTEIDSEINDSITDLHIAYTVNKVRDNSFINATQLTLIELGYKGTTDNYEEGIRVFGANTFTGVNGVPTTVIFSTVTEYEYDWNSTGRTISFSATLSALKDILLQVSEFTQNDLSEQDWNKLVNEIPIATSLIESGSTDVDAITDSFIILYNICKNRVVASFVVAVPAVVIMESDPKNNVMKTEVPISVKYRFPNLNHKLEISLQDDLKLIEANTGEIIPMFSKTPASVFTIADSDMTEDGYWYNSSKFDLYAENRAGSWSNMVTINISSKKE